MKEEGKERKKGRKEGRKEGNDISSALVVIKSHEKKTAMR